eukprot:COSAG02_NODE_857_length_16462_cov_4.801381_11_plen_107_part_00
MRCNTVLVMDAARATMNQMQCICSANMYARISAQYCATYPYYARPLPSIMLGSTWRDVERKGYARSPVSARSCMLAWYLAHVHGILWYSQHRRDRTADALQDCDDC